MTLTREQIVAGIRERVHIGARHYEEDLPDFICAHWAEINAILERGLPLPALRPEASGRQAEGEVKELLADLHELEICFANGDGNPVQNGAAQDVVKRARGTLSRQAASLATEYERGLRDGGYFRGLLTERCKELEASLAQKVPEGPLAPLGIDQVDILIEANRDTMKKLIACEASLASARREAIEACIVKVAEFHDPRRGTTPQHIIEALRSLLSSPRQED